VYRRHRRLSFGGTALATVAAALATASPALAKTATFEDPNSPSANAIDDIYRVVLGVTVTIFVLVAGWLVYSAIRFRERRRGDVEEPPQMHGSTRLELGWTVVPILILIGLAGYTFARLPDVEDVPSNAMDVEVNAFQFGFSFTYENGKTVDDTMTVPIDQPVRLLVRAEDVIHNYWVPELGPKIDAIPGQTNETWFTPTRLGTFHGQCAEFCGPGHAAMALDVRVVPQDEFEQFLAQEEQQP
jgi:cytochrome c oxidase subunit 2